MEIAKEDFRKMGHQLVDTLADFLETIRDRPVTTGESPTQVLAKLGNGNLPDRGAPSDQLLARATDLLLQHSLFNGHPKFFGYITSSPAPITVLSDMLASAVNPNVGANILSPMATAIEKQTVKWLAEFVGVPGYGGILVSGGNMANFTAFLAARNAKSPVNLKTDGLVGSGDREMVFYCSKATHTWIEKAAVLFGHGMKAIRWIPTDAHQKMDISVLKKTIELDKVSGKFPFMVIGNAGDVSTGSVDDLKAIAAVCKTNDLWFHIDGAYGAPAAALPGLSEMFSGFHEADSIALDPHKWLYAALEAGCTLIKNPQHLIDTYSSHPAYYNFDGSAEEPTTNFYEYGFQNSRGFRALKVWMALQQVGREGYVQLIDQNIRLANLLYEEAKRHPELEAVSHHLSITTLRYVGNESRLNHEQLEILNKQLLNNLQIGGEVFLSNAVIADKYCLRACIVNFRTTEKDIHEVIDIIVREGRKALSEIQRSTR